MFRTRRGKGFATESKQIYHEDVLLKMEAREGYVKGEDAVQVNSKKMEALNGGEWVTLRRLRSLRLLILM